LSFCVCSDAIELRADIGSSLGGFVLLTRSGHFVLIKIAPLKRTLLHFCGISGPGYKPANYKQHGPMSNESVWLSSAGRCSVGH